MSESFKALLLDEAEGGKPQAAITEVALADLPEGEVTVAVAYSSLNYKDGLAVTGAGRVVRAYPMVPGIDFAGTVEQSTSPDYKPGDEVVLTGWGVGERHWGGHGQRARVKADWLLPLQEGFSLQRAMAVGTAGFTAMLCVMGLEHMGLERGKGEVLVTGAAGGVGSVAVAVLANLGYHVIASTGREDAHDYLGSLGAAAIIDRAELAAPGKPLAPERWAGAVDTVGGQTLVSALAATRYGGAVAACGLAGGSDLPATVFPFILRGLSLVGVDSVMCPTPRRLEAWARLARDLP
ncbi:MAG: MDR family oxidoreductase, partial [Alphaproteobacteria bacterium]